MPKELGRFEEKKVVIGIGRFGPYIRHDSKFVSLKEIDPHEIKLDTAIEMIVQKREDDANKIILEFPENSDISVLNGRWGPYIKAGKLNVKIPKDQDPKELTLEECLKLAKNAPAKKKFKRKKSK